MFNALLIADVRKEGINHAEARVLLCGDGKSVPAKRNTDARRFQSHCFSSRIGTRDHKDAEFFSARERDGDRFFSKERVSCQFEIKELFIGDKLREVPVALACFFGQGVVQV